MPKVFYSNDANIELINDRTISIIGFGVQGRSQALNLRDSGCKVIVGNIEDKYYVRAVAEGFTTTSIEDAVKSSSIIFFLIPDQAQREIYLKSFEPYLKSGDMLIFAHGYSIHYGEIIPPDFVDICLLAPRMPGRPIREYYLNGSGAPAYMDVHQNASGKAQETVLALAKALGFTEAGVMKLSFREETELDLFVEHFLLPIIIRSIRIAFDTLSEGGYTKEAVLMELFASGEIGELMLMASKIGLYDVWRQNASPTCQFGVMRNSEKVLNTEQTKQMIKDIVSEIKDKTFVEDLNEEAISGYCRLKSYDERNEESEFSITHKKIKKMFRNINNY